MAIMTGIEAAHEFREAGSSAKPVSFPVNDQPAFLDACFNEGALGYVVKSHRGKDLIAAINQALSGHDFISPMVSR